jgi:hypothetical protein
MESVGFEYITNLAKDVGLIKAVKDKLVRHPDPAAEKLAAALLELSKVFTELERGLTKYNALSFYESQDSVERKQERDTLVQLEGGELRTEMKRAKTHCKKIWNIYLKFLNPWFRSVLNESDQVALASVFSEMDEADSHFLEEIEALAKWLSDRARETLDLVDAGKIEEANKHIRAARIDTRKQQEAIVNAIGTLLDLEAEFTEVSRAV